MPKPKPRTARKPAKAPKAKKASDKAPNLLITIDERYRKSAEKDVGDLLARAGVRNFKILKAPGPGMAGVSIEEDPKMVLERLDAVLHEDPFAFRHTHRWMPIETWVKADLDELKQYGKRFSQQIGPDETWRICVDRHGSKLDRDEVIKALAAPIENDHVDLDHAKKTIQLEIVGAKAGIALLEDRQMLQVDRAIREDFVEFEEVGAVTRPSSSDTRPPT